MKSILFALAVTFLSTVAFAQCAPGGVNYSYYYDCRCQGEDWYLYIAACMGPGTGCDPLYYLQPCGPNCHVETASGCTYHQTAKSVDNRLEADAIDVPGTTSKSSQCPTMKLFDHWLAQKLGSRNNRVAGGLQ